MNAHKLTAATNIPLRDFLLNRGTLYQVLYYCSSSVVPVLVVAFHAEAPILVDKSRGGRDQGIRGCFAFGGLYRR